MASLDDLIATFEVRRNVASKKVSSGYRAEYYSGIEFAYSEALTDLKRMRDSQ